MNVLSPAAAVPAAGPRPVADRWIGGDDGCTRDILRPAAGKVIARANATERRFAANIQSRAIQPVSLVVDTIETGMAHITEGMISSEVPPFGRMKTIGFGGEGLKYGIEEFLDQQYVLISKNGSSRGEAQ